MLISRPFLFPIGLALLLPSSRRALCRDQGQVQGNRPRGARRLGQVREARGQNRLVFEGDLTALQFGDALDDFAVFEDEASHRDEDAGDSHRHPVRNARAEDAGKGDDSLLGKNVREIFAIARSFRKGSNLRP